MTPRRFPNWSRIALFVLLPFVTYSVWDYVETARLVSRIDAIEQRKEPIVMPGAKPTGDARQAERLYRAAAALVVSPGELPIQIAERKAFKAGPNDPWTPEMLTLARKRVDINREALALVDRAAYLPFVGFLPGTDYNYLDADLAIPLPAALELRAALALHEGHGEDALSAFYSEARLARALDSMRGGRSIFALIPPFSGLSAAVAAAPRSSVRDALGSAFADLDHDDRLRRALMLSRAKTLNAIGPRRHAANPILAHMIVTQLDEFEDLLTAAEKPWPERVDAMNAVDKWPETYPFPNGGRILRDFTRRTVDPIRRIRCARLIVSATPLELVDPFTGMRLEPSACHL
jgi:hypothetical protein